MDRVETLGLAGRELQHARGDDLQPRFLEAVEDVADQVAGDAVGLDDGQGTLERHGILKVCRGWPNGPRILAPRVRRGNRGVRGSARP